MNYYQHVDHKGATIDLPLGKVVCVGRNYLLHIKELNNALPTEPLLFIKPNTALCDLSKPVVIPKGMGECHNELELAVLISQPLTKCSAQQAQQAMWGVGLGLDLTLRALQSKAKEQGHPWERAKAFDLSCPVSKFIPAKNIDNLQNLSFSLQVNSEIRQQGHSQDMLYSIVDLLVNVSETFTLLPGDIVMTGTPKGVGPLFENDNISAQLEGYLSINTVVE